MYIYVCVNGCKDVFECKYVSMGGYVCLHVSTYVCVCKWKTDFLCSCMCVCVCVGDVCWILQSGIF